MRYFLLILLSLLSLTVVTPISAATKIYAYDVPSPACVAVGNQPCAQTVSPSASPNTVSPRAGGSQSGSPSTQPSIAQNISGSPSPSAAAPCSTSQSSVSSQSTNNVQAFHYHGKHHHSAGGGFLQQFIQFFWQLLQQLFKQLGISLPNITIPCGSYSSPSGTPSTESPSGSPSVSSGAPSSQPSIPTTTSGATVSSTPPTSPTSGMMVGLNESYTQNQASDIAGAVDSVRYDPNGPESISDFINAGLKIDVLLEGPYEANGVSGLGSPTAWASNWLSWYKSHGCTPTICPVIEVLNEPGGTWFWGSNAMSSTNAQAYGALLEATYNAFHQAYGSSKPAILASYDGGESNSVAWGQEVWSLTPNLNNYVDGVTVHPYGGISDPTTSAQGYRPDVIAANSQTGKPVYVTEIGWPTGAATGNSLSWTEPQQCNNIYNFISWARGLGYVKAVMIFEHLDDASDGPYGVESTSGVKKPSYDGLKAAAANQANPCPSS